MNLDSLSFTLSQISYLVATLTKKNYKQSVEDLTKLVSLHGLEADRHLLQCLFSSVDFTESTSKIPTVSPQNQALLEQCSSLLNKPSLPTAVCYITDNPLVNQKTIKVGPQFFQQLSKCLRLSAVQEVVFAFAFCHSSITEVAHLSQAHLRTSVPALVQSYIDTEGSSRQHEGGLHETTPEVLHLILSAVLKNPKEVGLTSEVHTAFLRTLQKDFPKDLVPVVLAPLVYPEQSELSPEMSSEGPGLSGGMLETSMTDLVIEIGYSLTSSVEECRNNLLKLGGRDLAPAAVARILAVMCRSHSGLEDSLGLQAPGSFNKSSDSNTSWNLEIFIQAIKEIVPNFQWNIIVAELDHTEFIIKDRQGLCILVNALRQGLQTFGFHPENFPIDQFYKRWQNVEGQFSLIQHILKNPDVFCFADFSCIPVAVDVLKTPPEQDGKELANWRSLQLVELLLNLSECGLYTHVQELFKVPVHSCPDVLVLALLQISGPVTLLRQELLTNLIPIFLGNHPNSAIVLHHAWHAQTVNIKPVIMHAMAEWYARGECDQARLSRILDVAQDLKALSMLLNAQSAQSYPFIIDLACLASRREYLKLEKWLSDKINEHGETFAMACVKFLHRRCPQIAKEDALAKSSPLPTETLATMIVCLQRCVNSVSPDCQEAILTVVGNCSLVVKSRQQQQQPTILRSRGMEAGLNPSVFAGQLYNPSDSIPGLSNNLANMSLAEAFAGPAGSAFNIPGGLGPLVPSPGSPSRLLNAGGPSNSPFPVMPMSHQGPVGTSSSLVLGVNQLNNMGRMPNPTIDKGRMPETNLFPDVAPVSKEIEDEANNYFQRIYNHPPNPTLSIDEVLAMLKRFQDSHNKREKEVFNCMLRSLFEEYKFFPQYPDKELHVTAQLFGGIVDKGIVTSYMALGLALRFVLEALKKPEGSKMYYFGIAALDRFKNRLKEFHKYCEHVRAISHFGDFPQHLQEYIEYGLQSLEPPHKPEGPVLPASLAAMLAPVGGATGAPAYKPAAPAAAPAKGGSSSTVRPSIANATNIDTLLGATEKDDKVVAPPEQLQDKMAFIFNNLSQLNLKQKCDELKELVSEDYHPWLAQYLVMKRASIEFNFHALYSNFLDTLGSNDFLKSVTRETFRNIRVLLRSDKAIANFSDRSLLKNLGHWLGILTLSRNRPILQIDLDLKSLVVEAYHKGQQELLYVVPFVAKVLEACAKSKVFKPPNPWTISIMNVLAELHSETDLKLTLKFEIEVLCKHLEIDVANLKPAVYLKDPERIRRIEYQLSQPAKKEAAAQAAQSATAGNLTDQELGNVVPGRHASSPAGQNDSAGAAAAVAAAPEPRFNFADIQVAGMQAFQTHTVVSPSILLFQSQPQLKALVRNSIERAVQEWIAPVVERSIKISLQTCEQVIRKDFALDPDENRMRMAAHYMVRNLTAGMAMITCREQLLSAINTHLKQSLLTNIVTPTNQQKEMIEQAATVIANDNMELACAFVQKTAVEKAILEIDKRLMSEYELRKMARTEGRRYCDALSLTFQAERMPEPIRLKVGGISSTQMVVYEEFARNIPGFLPNERDAQILMQKQTMTPIESQPHSSSTPFAVPPTGLAADDLTLLYEKLVVEVEQFVQLTAAQPPYAHINANMMVLRDCLMHVLRNRDLAPPQAVVQKCVESLQDCLGPNLSDTDAVLMRFKEAIVRILKTMQDPRVYGQQWTNKLVTRYLTECRDEQQRYNIDAVDMLIKSGLVNVPQYDLALAQCMESGVNYLGVSFSMQLVQLYLIDDRSGQFVTESDLCNTIEMLAKLQTHMRQPPEGLGTIIDVLRQNEPSSFFGDRAPMGPTVHIHNGILQVRAPNYEDPPGLVEKTDQLLRDWVTIYHSQQQGRDSTKAFSMFVHQMNVYGILKTDDLITRFFRLSTQLCVENVYRTLADKTSLSAARPKCYHMLDAFVRLVSLLVKHSGDATNTTTKVHLLNKVLGIVAGCLLQNHDTPLPEFQQLPYQRIFTMLFLELNAPEPVLEAINFHVLTAYCHTLHILRPSKAAGFCYAWLELVSHRVFMGRMLASSPQQKCWPLYAQLLIDLFKYLAPFLRNAELAKPVTMLYKGTLRVLLVLLHDFPEFLCDYHYGFCDVIPPNCIQMRNLILSAFPRNMRLPDPFTPNLKVDLLQEITFGPRILTNVASMIAPAQFKKDLDSYLKARAPVTFLSELRSNLQVSNEPGVRYNIPLMNALVLYVGTQAIAYIRNKSHQPNMSTIAHSAHMDIFQNLAVDLDTEGRYLFLNAIANQLRYPNSHTHYFSCTLLYLFAEANTEAIQEQITRVLLERLIVNRPHPWGLLITFIELIKNPTYRFWQHEFVHCAPEIEKLFESVARSCMVKSTLQAQDNEIQE